METAIEAPEALLEPAQSASIVIPGALEASAELAVSRASIESVTTYLGSVGSDSSRETILSSMRRIARLLGIQTTSDDPDSWKRVPWTTLGARETTMIQSLLVQRCSPNTARQTMSLLRGVFHQAFRLGHMSAEQYQRAIDTVPVKGTRLSSGRELSKDEVSTLRSYVNELPSPYSVQTWAIFSVALGGGLRRDEIARLHERSWSADGLRVRGKGNRERLQPLPVGASGALQHWIAARSELGLQCEALFVQFWRSGPVRDAGITGAGVWRLITETGKAAGLDHFGPHDLRRTFATRMLRLTKDLSTVQGLLGHVSPTTTAMYDMRGDEERAEAVTLLDEWGEGAALDGSTEVIARAHAAAAMPTRDLAWLQHQVRALDERGYSSRQIAATLTKSGIKKVGGLELTCGDVERLL